MEDYTFTNKNIRNEYWIQYDGNRGFHPADSKYGKGWQPESHFVDVAKSAYSHWAKGEGRTYPDSYGSNGCVNMMLKDIAVLYGLCDVGDNVLVIGPNDLIKNNLLSSTNNFTFAFDDNDNLYVIGRDKEIVMVIESIDQDTKKVKPKEYNFNPDAMDDKQKVKTLSNV